LNVDVATFVWRIYVDRYVATMPGTIGLSLVPIHKILKPCVFDAHERLIVWRELHIAQHVIE
jgi:hypothetical protein